MSGVQHHARRLDRNPGDDARYHRAFLLPAVPSVDAGQSLVVPQGWFRNDRTIELFTDGVWQVRLLHVLDDGPDFERVSFVVC
jgi:hypothetical protein